MLPSVSFKFVEIRTYYFNGKPKILILEHPHKIPSGKNVSILEIINGITGKFLQIDDMGIVYCDYNDESTRVWFSVPSKVEDLYKEEFNKLLKVSSNASPSSSTSSNGGTAFGSEPYTSTAVRDIRNKKDLNFDDLFYLCRGNTPFSALKKYYRPQFDGLAFFDTYMSPKTLYGHPLSEVAIQRNYENFWYLSGEIYFGPTGSQEAINEANSFIDQIYEYLIKRGRKVSYEENRDYPGCHQLVFNEGHGTHSDIKVVNGGLYHKNKEAAWGVVIHISYPYN